jgi:TolA-binding protein
MTQFWQIICRGRKKLLDVGVSPRTLLTCFLVALAPVEYAATSADADWSNLAPPPSALETNSTASDLNTTNFPPELANLALDTNSVGTNDFASQLAMAGYYQKTAQPEKAEPILIGLLAGNVPETIQKAAMMELGSVVRDENDLPRAQSIYEQYTTRWPDDPRLPEIYLRQGQLFRQMGVTDLALAKFYSVMSAALTIKNDQLPYYKSLVLRTQVEIAETHYLMGHYIDAADFYKRLLDNPDEALNRPQMQFRLIRSLTIIKKNDEAVSEAQDFLTRYPDSDETAEVRYYMAQALKGLGRDNEGFGMPETAKSQGRE